jgi:hypothetical protein
MNLPIHQKNAIDLLPKDAQVFVRARFESHVLSQLKENEAKSVILDAISLCLAEAGHQKGNDEQVKVFLTQRVYDDCIKHFKQLRVAELSIALNEGVRGNYGQFMGINVTTINAWIKAFLGSQARKTSFDYYNLLIDQETTKKEPTEQERDKIMKQACINAFNDYLHNGSLPVTPVTIYNYLRAELGIKWTPEEREQIKKEAEVSYKGKKREENPFKKIKETEDGTIAEQKRVALLHYFRKLKANGETISFKRTV